MGRNEYYGECCCCVPLRRGVLVLAVLTVISGFAALIGLFTDKLVTTTGGFNSTSKVIAGVVGACGLIFGLIGTLGAYDSTAAYVRYFWQFTVAHLFISLVIFVMDLIELHSCESWTNDVQAKVNYNPVMDEIANRGLCSETRTWYAIGFLVEFFLNSYFSWVIYQFVRALESGASYKIHFDRDTPPQVFVASADHQANMPNYGALAARSVPAPQMPVAPVAMPVSASSPPAYYGGPGNGVQGRSSPLPYQR